MQFKEVQPFVDFKPAACFSLVLPLSPAVKMVTNCSHAFVPHCCDGCGGPILLRVFNSHLFIAPTAGFLSFGLCHSNSAIFSLWVHGQSCRCYSRVLNKKLSSRPTWHRLLLQVYRRSLMQNVEPGWRSWSSHRAFTWCTAIGMAFPECWPCAKAGFCRGLRG